MRIALIAGNDVADTLEQRGLAAGLRRAGHEVTEDAMDAGRDAGGDVRAAVPAFAESLRSRWLASRPDVVHAFGWAGGLAALAAARDAGLPVVTALGSLAATEARHGLAPRLERARLERAIGAASATMIAASSEEASDLLRAGVTRRRTRHIPVGIDTSVFSPDSPVSADARGTRDGKPRVITAAGIDDEQSVTLARAMAAVPGAELITCPADAPEDELAALLRSASVFVHVPAHAPRGLECLRAMACGVPVIASGVGTHTDMVIEGTTGLLVPPGRPALLAARIRHLLGHPLLHQACGVAATDRAQSRYSRGRITAETLAVYQDATATGQSLAA